MNDHYECVRQPRRWLRVRPGVRRRAPLLAVLLVAACTARPPVEPATLAAPSASGASAAPDQATPVAPDAWGFADVVQPDVVTQAPSLQPGYHCSPCHPAAASQLFAIAPTADGYLAVGVQQPPAVAIAVASADGRSWRPIDGWQPGEGTAAIGVASGAPGTVVVGSGPGGAAAWVCHHGRCSQAVGTDLAGSPGATAMTAVTPWRDGFVAGGYRDDPAHATASAAVWRSDDGRSWRLAGPEAAFAGGRILGVAARGDVVVAVGSAGDPSYGPAAAWVSTGGSWRRATVPDPGGVMRAVTATPDGFVAVGQDASDAGARAWRSSDGETWTAVADQPAFHHGSSPVRMESVDADEAGIVAGGWRADAANGSAAAWSSPDGVRWEAADWVPSFSGGQIPGIALSATTVLGVGRSGYPDNNQAAAWIRARP